MNEINERCLLFLAFSSTIVSKAFGKWVVVDFQLSNLKNKRKGNQMVNLKIHDGCAHFFILVGSDSNELSFRKCKRVKRRVWQF